VIIYYDNKLNNGTVYAIRCAYTKPEKKFQSQFSKPAQV